MGLAKLSTAPEPEPLRFPSVEEVDRITALPDLALRNLHVTQGYYELSTALALRLGPCSNWCTFAIWASKQAGQTIRREDFADLLEQKLAAAPELAQAFGEVFEAVARFGSRLDRLKTRIFGQRLLLSVVLDRASDAISRGNTKVFEEIGREISRFLATFADEASFDGDRIARFVEPLRPGDPPDGQGYLRRALTHLYEALFATDTKTRAEKILLANLEIGFHEQTRLQPEIQDALEAAMPDREELRRHLLRMVLPGAGLLLRLRLRLPRVLRHTGPLDRALDRLFETFQGVLRRAVTEALMRLEFPDGAVLQLSRDLRRSFPSSVRTIADPELRSLLAKIDPTADSIRGSGAEDWADFPERMHYIADLFRGFQEEPSLSSPPFTPDQVAILKVGRRPSGRL